MPTPAAPRIRVLPTADLAEADAAAIRNVLDAAFERDEHGGFTWDDWLHALGGSHVVMDIDGRIAGHASVVERALEIGGRPVRTGYVEAVAVLPELQRTGMGTLLMGVVNAIVSAGFEMGALGTGSQPFYERLGWQIWQGPTGVRVDGAVQLTPDEDGYILVLPTPTSPPFQLTEPITCGWRAGDVW